MGDWFELYLIHGFLGSGKTTFLWEMARRLLGEGKRVGLITNDQVPDLVDTAWLKRTGATVAEVHGSCFCCNFAGFVRAIEEIRRQISPEVIFAEPVGSCADLAATVARPLQKQFAGTIRLAPLTVVVDAQRFERILRQSPHALRSGAAYIFAKQIEEADVLAINKVDLVDDAFLKILEEKLREVNADAPLVRVSAKRGTGLAAWWQLVKEVPDAAKRALEIDYDRYAAGEEELGWLNASFECEGSTDWNRFALEFLRSLQRAFRKDHIIVGHAKFLLETPTDCLAGNLSDTEGNFEIRGMIPPTGKVNMTLNVRAAAPPEDLGQVVRGVLMEVAKDSPTIRERTWRCIRPGRPQPSCRMLP